LDLAESCWMRLQKMYGLVLPRVCNVFYVSG